jgi:hypothetical protein
MTDGQGNRRRNPPPFDELKSKRFGRHVGDATRFRKEVLSRDPDSAVSHEEAATILGIQVSEVAPAMDDERLGFIEVSGERIIRVADLQSALHKEAHKRQEAADGWMRLRADWDD